MIDTLSRLFRSLLEAVVVLLLAALSGVTVAGVAFRKAGASLVWYDEVASILLVWLTYYGACLVALDRGHIGFPNLMRSVPASMRTLLAAMRHAVVIGFFAVMAWAGWRVLLVLEGNTLVSLPWVPTRLTQSVIPFGAVLFIVAELFAMRGDKGDGASSEERETA